MRTTLAPTKSRILGAANASDLGATGVPRTKLIVFALGLIEVGLLGWALAYGAREVRDGAGTVTTGYNVALSLALTIFVVIALERLALPSRLRDLGQIALLGGQALHALGHLARLYYVVPGYDDVLHFGFVCAAAILLLRLAQAWNLFPDVHATPLRAALITFVLALALAGAWEIFEYAMDTLQGSREQDDLTDTMTDMVDGLFGGLAGALVAWRRPRSHP